MPDYQRPIAKATFIELGIRRWASLTAKLTLIASDVWPAIYGTLQKKGPERDDILNAWIKQ